MGLDPETNTKTRALGATRHRGRPQAGCSKECPSDESLGLAKPPLAM